eukprot:scaffold5782_cov618-Prasinococcus_capsulatus_cf.AAC.19
MAFFSYEVSLDQAFAHCPIFLTAASRWSLGRLSVPMWRVILSDPLRVIGLGSFSLSNYLILHRLIFSESVAFKCEDAPWQNEKVDSYVFLTRSLERYTLESSQLACITHTSSVHSEPGSNS